MKKRVYVVSHSHWDREWYMGYEAHHMRLVSLMDDLFDLFANDPDFNSFHLDGQTIILEDYLKVRPEKRAELAKWIAAGKLKIGPFYILQDDFLISPEANVRNTQYGLKDAAKWGQPVPLGYFPDTFGNMGQTAQMMRLAGLDTVAFGRGVTPTGLNNQTGGGDFDSTYSEMWWQGPDGSQVLAILFANWYSNGNEIPVEAAAAKVYWDQHLKDAEQFAATPDLLFMNGIDHQPVQKDISAALATANRLYPDYQFIHASFADYIQALKADLPDDLSTIHGELTSQATNGWYTLANTASSRVYLKQKNTQVERLLEDQVEPLLALSQQGSASNQDRLDYAWRLLLQNHPHDSICGCSVDAVHQRMQTRFDAAQQVGDSLAARALQALADDLDTRAFAAEAHPFVVVNTSGAAKQDAVTVSVELERALFADGAPQAQYDRMQAAADKLSAFQVADASGKLVPAHVSKPYVHFNYELPDDRFRVPFMGLYVDVEVAPALAAFSWATLAVVPAQTPACVPSALAGNAIENQALRVALEADGTVTVADLRHGATYKDALVFEDCGDTGNEYIFKEAADRRRFTSRDGVVAGVAAATTVNGQTLHFDLTLALPVAADERLAYEQQAVIDVTQRTSGRSQKTRLQTLAVTLTLVADESRVQVRVTGDNQVKDHRLRAVINTGMHAETHQAESLFELVTRPNAVTPQWQNPTNPQHQQAFATVHTADRGVVVGNLGLNEYEVGAHGEWLAVTLLRGIGEMGDWGYFPTPEAQCLGAYTADFSIAFTDGSEAEQLAAMQVARAAQIPLLAVQTGRHAGKRAANDAYLTVSDPAFAVTATKATATGDFLVRGYNLLPQARALTVACAGRTDAQLLDLVDQPLAGDPAALLAPAEIRTYVFHMKHR